MTITSLFVRRPLMSEHLFCYGTLCFADIMRRVSGALPRSTPGMLLDYACYGLAGLPYPGIVPQCGNRVNGVLYQGLSRAQFAKLDAYEGAQYRRIRVWIRSGQDQRVRAWTYVLQPRYYHRLSGQAWSLEQFRVEQLARYLYHSQNKMYGLHGRDTNQSA